MQVEVHGQREPPQIPQEQEINPNPYIIYLGSLHQELESKPTKEKTCGEDDSPPNCSSFGPWIKGGWMDLGPRVWGENERGELGHEPSWAREG